MWNEVKEVIRLRVRGEEGCVRAKGWRDQGKLKVMRYEG